jgi:Zn-dependent protease/CBS domain-containing protein
MKWSWKLSQLAGIDIRIHATFLLLLGWIAASYWATGKGLEAMLAGIVFITALFACVVLHELGHALAARKFGIRTTDITLLPIGGLARLERMPEEPRQELWIVLGGPAVNVAIASVLYAWLSINHEWEPLVYLKVATGPFVERLFFANVSLALFNLIPAFPMDGGRVLRALLASRMPYPKATQIAASVGQGLALIFGVIGLFTNPMLLLIAVFVWVGASQESGAVQVKSALSGTPVKAAMLKEFATLHYGSNLSDAVTLSLNSSQRDFPVIAQNRVAGMLTGSDMLAALAEHGGEYPVTLAMRTSFPVADSAEMLDTVFQRLKECDCAAMPVFRNGWLVGLITTDNLGEYLLIEATLQKYGARAGFMNRVGPRVVRPRDPAGSSPFGDNVQPPHSVMSDRV